MWVESLPTAREKGVQKTTTTVQLLNYLLQAGQPRDGRTTSQSPSFFLWPTGSATKQTQIWLVVAFYCFTHTHTHTHKDQTGWIKPATALSTELL